MKIKNLLLITLLSFSKAFCMEAVEKEIELHIQNLQEEIQEEIASRLSTIDPEQQCVICLENIDQIKEEIVMPCSNCHIFHKECGFRWIAENGTCPLCNELISQAGEAIKQQRDREEQIRADEQLARELSINQGSEEQTELLEIEVSNNPSPLEVISQNLNLGPQERIRRIEHLDRTRSVVILETLARNGIVSNVRYVIMPITTNQSL